MNNFFTDNFQISKINMCVFVPAGTGRAIHQNRSYHGLVLNLSGKKKYVFTDGGIMHTKEGSVFYLPKFSNYEVEEIEKGDCIAINFELADSNVTYPFFDLMPTHNNPYIHKFNTVLDNWDAKKNGCLNLCFSHLYDIIYNIQQDKLSKYIPSKNTKTVNDATEYILTNLSDPSLTIEKISSIYGITPEYFRKLFNIVHHTSPKNYIINLRIEKAKELLLSGEFNISTISKMCGYNSESHFSNIFKIICNCTPSEYLNDQINN